MEEFLPYLTRIWSTGVVTNNGPLVREFEKRLRDYTGAKHAFFVSNGTLALQLAIRALNIKGQILTTPFSMIATLDSILWENYEPVFADIDPDSLNLSPEEVKKTMSEKIGCILATHVYGNSCEIESLTEIAAKAKIPLIFDASHAFGSTYRERDIMTFGTISTLSLQAYKIFHTVEGGAIFTNDDAIAKSIFRMRYFGYDENMDVKSVGMNGKSSEINAAIGLCCFDHFQEVASSRQKQSDYYDSLIASHKLCIKRPLITTGSKFNNAYYAIIFSSEADLIKVQREFDKKDIQFKRYFYPSLNTLGVFGNFNHMPVSESIVSKVICLPMHFHLTTEDQDIIINALASALK